MVRRQLRRGVGLAGIAGGIALMVAALLPALSGRGAASPAPPPEPARHVDGRLAVPTVPPATGPAHPERAVADPRRILIPAIGLTADLVPLDLRPNGELAVPEDFTLPGWYANGPEPGEPGPAVIVGHVDSRVGPAVFFRLSELRPDHHIVIETVRGATFTFVVERIEQRPKERFPTAAVYGPTAQRVLRLITCGGAFDRASGSYRDNIVVFARRID